MKHLFFLGIFIYSIIYLSTLQGQSYCSTGFSNGTLEYIENITFSNINNNSGGSAYSNFTSIVGNVVKGTAYNFSVKFKTDGTEYIFVFIDWNANGILNDVSEVFNIGSAGGQVSGNILTSTITVPASAITGNTRMRIILQYSNATPNPCVAQTYGECEDYTLSISAGCTDVSAPTAVSGSASPPSAVVNSAITLTGSATDNVGVIKIEWYNGAVLIGSKTGSPFTYSYTFTTVGNYSITTKAYDACNNAGTSATTFTVTITAADPCSTNSPPSISGLNGTPSAINSGQNVTFTVSASDLNGNLIRVDYYDGTTLIGSNSVSPYGFSTTTLAIGNRVITAKAIDACSSSSASSNAVTITVTSSSSGSGNSWSAITITDPTYRTGKVHIGKSNTNTGPETSYNLFVTGGIKSEKFKIELSSAGGWADNIFNTDFKLMPITKLEKYIKINKHLPGFASEAQIIEAGGYEMSDMIKKQQESIEKLFLYIIELEHKLQKTNELGNRIPKKEKN